MRIIILVLSIVILVSCTNSYSVRPTLHLTDTPATIVSSTPSPTIKPTPTMTDTPSPTPYPWAGFTISSPLEDVPIAELSQIISNPFDRPSPGFDDKHHGVDFAYYSRGNHRQMLGLRVFSVFNGRVAGVVLNRPPYGNAIIIESGINNFPPSILMTLKQPDALTPYPYNSRLTCKELATADFAEVVGSIYSLYAHLENAPLLKVGDEVISGVQIGSVGNSGYSGNPHLHLEMRWGKSGQSFQSISYYDASATPEERSEYCAWRISGRFALMDPMAVLIPSLEYSSATTVP